MYNNENRAKVQSLVENYDVVEENGVVKDALDKEDKAEAYKVIIFLSGHSKKGDVKENKAQPCTELLTRTTSHKMCICDCVLYMCGMCVFVWLNNILILGIKRVFDFYFATCN